MSPSSIPPLASFLHALSGPSLPSMTHSPHPSWANTSSCPPSSSSSYPSLFSSSFFLHHRCLVCHPISPSSVLPPPISLLISSEHNNPPLSRSTFAQSGAGGREKNSLNRTFFVTYLFIRCHLLSWRQMTLPPRRPATSFVHLSFFSVCTAEHFNVNNPLSHKNRSIIMMVVSLFWLPAALVQSSEGSEYQQICLSARRARR